MGIPSPGASSPLLLPHFPELVILLKPQGPVIDQLPPWLAEIVAPPTAVSSPEFFQILAQRLPG
ncbi:MAG TPA: hypothetical protein PKO06_18465, partial [Candidatus Ozemobacteraceae bacterium]|nr:hypothetical protein [Candidatus Ozemobacteraceae bacterium]